MEYLVVEAAFTKFPCITFVEVHINPTSILYTIPRDMDYWEKKYGPIYHTFKEFEKPTTEFVLTNGDIIDVCKIKRTQKLK